LGHIIDLSQKVKAKKERDWYATQASLCGWARDALARNIKSNLYHRQGKAELKQTNFETRLPIPQSTFAHELIKEPYDLGFLQR